MTIKRIPGIDLVSQGPLTPGELVNDRLDYPRLHPALRDATSIVLHRFGTDPRYEKWRVSAESLKPQNSFGPISFSSRNAPPLFGAGRIDAIPDEVIVAAARRHDDRFPAVRGRVSRLGDGRIGRFGWKAQVSNLRDFVLSACANELGLEVPGHHQAASPFESDGPAARLDMTADECDALVSYVRNLPSPVSRPDWNANGATVLAEGRRLFDSIGCATCHTPNLGDVDGIYSDLLLHDLGSQTPDVAVYYAEGSSTQVSTAGSLKTNLELARLWRTAPLWGLRDSGPYMHDGAAKTVEEAIALHRVDADDSTTRYFALSDREHRALKVYLDSLAAPARTFGRFER